MLFRSESESETKGLSSSFAYLLLRVRRPGTSKKSFKPHAHLPTAFSLSGSTGSWSSSSLRVSLSSRRSLNSTKKSAAHEYDSEARKDSLPDHDLVQKIGCGVSRGWDLVKNSRSHEERNNQDGWADVSLRGQTETLREARASGGEPSVGERRSPSSLVHIRVQ